MGRTKTLRTDYLARVEGEGAMLVKIRDGKPVDVKLRIYEPPRFFEAFLRGRHFTEAPDITARICGICPVAYQTSSVNAMEDACGVDVGPQIRALRRLLYCGEWIESHALHVFMLHAPDFLGYASAIELAKDHRELVERALHMKKTGNEVMRVVGGREVHPINVRVGGFYRAPSKRELATLVDDLERAREFALETVRFTAGLDFPEFEQDYELVALSAAGRLRGRGRPARRRTAASTSRCREYEQHFVEEHVEWSNALHSHVIGRGNYLVGPLARWALSGDRLTPLALEAAKEAGPRARRAQPVPDDPDPLGRARLRRRRGAAADRRSTSRPTRRSSRSSLAPASATAAARRRAASAGTATRSTTKARSSTRRSSRPPHRTRRRSSPTCTAWSSATPTCRTTSCRCAASRRSATTTRASPARPTS